MSTQDLYPGWMRAAAAALGMDPLTLWAIWQDGYTACDEEIAALQRAAVRNVHALIDVPARDRDADHARRQRVDARWAS